MFRLLPVVQATVLPFLPVEMWSSILRFLDPKSLLDGVRAHKPWLEVCRGDPLLREKLKLAVKEEKQFVKDYFMNGHPSMRISRTAPSMKFGRNSNKTATNVSKLTPLMLPKSDAIFTTMKQKTTKKAGRNTNSRFSPYRL